MIVAIIQARLGSKRLPGKVLMKISNKPLLSYLIERVACCTGIGDQIVVATPDKDGESINQQCMQSYQGVSLFTVGIEESDVWLRFSHVINQMSGTKTIIRICADSPMLDPALVDWMVEQHEGGITTNVQPRTFPAGQCIEIIDTDVFLAGTPETVEDREHVMPYYYRNCKFKNVRNPLGDFSAHRMVVDTQEDFDRIKAVIEKMDRPHWTYGWQEIVEMMK